VARIDVGSEQAELVASSFALVEPNARQATALFVRRLEQTAPALRQLFPTDPVVRSDEVVATVAAVIQGLDDPPTLDDVTSELARRRVEHGIGADDCEAIGEAMLWTLSTGLGHRFGEQHRRAWRDAYLAVTESILTARPAV
jgi:hemoglobin-like flavoprotein